MQMDDKRYEVVTRHFWIGPSTDIDRALYTRHEVRLQANWCTTVYQLKGNGKKEILEHFWIGPSKTVKEREYEPFAVRVEYDWCTTVYRRRVREEGQRMIWKPKIKGHAIVGGECHEVDAEDMSAE